MERTRPKSRIRKKLGDAAGNNPPDTADTELTVVGIGASAGGLEALELFLKNIPPASGLAFVIVQHLDPSRNDRMVELLQRSTSMPVLQIKDRLRMKGDHVYVIPPNRNLSILHGVLHLLEPTAPRGLRLPIDFFLRSLADDQRENSVGVVLSGMGSDGTLGLRAIKEHAGGAFVQSPASAKFDNMPRSAIDAGVADVVASPEELPEQIIAYLQHARVRVVRPKLDLTEKDQSDLEKTVLLLRAHTGHDFSFYKKSTTYRRIERRMGLQRLTRLSDYVRYLRENPLEIDLLFKELLVGVTSFFRDAAVWEQLKSDAIPSLLAKRPNGGALRAWTPACSTGEEAYSLAITFREVLDALKPKARYTLQVFATDLDKDAIEIARAGVYPASIAADVSEERLHRYFCEEGSGFRVAREIREMVVFAPQNLIMDPPFTKLDILTCRNLLIYLETELQKRLLPLFAYSLNPGGILVLGTSESTGPSTDLFSPLEGPMRLFRRHAGAMDTEQLDVPFAFTRLHPGSATPQAAAITGPPSVAGLQAQTESLLLKRFCPAAVLTNEKGDISYVSGKTGKYLEPATGKANLNVFAMARDGLRGELNLAFAKAIRERTTVTLHGLSVGTNGGTQLVDVSILPLSEPGALLGMVLIVFTDLPTPAVKRSRTKAGSSAKHYEELADQARELQRSYEELQMTREEMQTSQEELQSTIEELQSTNEELTTSREEMQSMNEELQTVNHELQSKVDELSLAADDLTNLFNSTDIAILFLDGNLRVRRFTTRTTGIIKLIPGDAGRPVTDIVSDLDYPDLAEEARGVLQDLVFRERQVSARGGRWFTVRIMPYRTQDNRIDGVVITFVEVTGSKVIEREMTESKAFLESIYNGSDLPMTVVDVTADDDFVLSGVNPAYEQLTGVLSLDCVGKTLSQFLLPMVTPIAAAQVVRQFRRCVELGKAVQYENRTVVQGAPSLSVTRLIPLKNSAGKIFRIISIVFDVAGLPTAEAERGKGP